MNQRVDSFCRSEGKQARDRNLASVRVIEQSSESFAEWELSGTL
jgi:hypothetical protein